MLITLAALLLVDFASYDKRTSRVINAITSYNYIEIYTYLFELLAKNTKNLFFDPWPPDDIISMGVIFNM